ncbi:MAG: hypothetical protein ACSLE9_00860 [Burkholderiaceae bacterium]
MNITQQVLRAMTVALGALNAPAMPVFGQALRAASMHEDLEPMSRQMLADLAAGVEMLTGKGATSAH